MCLKPRVRLLWQRIEVVQLGLGVFFFLPLSALSLPVHCGPLQPGWLEDDGGIPLGVCVTVLTSKGLALLCLCSLSLSFVQLFVTPWTRACKAPPSMGFPSQEYWSRLPFSSSRGYSWLRDWTQVSRVSCIADGFSLSEIFTHEPWSCAILQKFSSILTPHLWESVVLWTLSPWALRRPYHRMEGWLISSPELGFPQLLIPKP